MPEATTFSPDQALRMTLDRIANALEGINQSLAFLSSGPLRVPGQVAKGRTGAGLLTVLERIATDVAKTTLTTPQPTTPQSAVE